METRRAALRKAALTPLYGEPLCAYAHVLTAVCGLGGVTALLRRTAEPAPAPPISAVLIGPRAGGRGGRRAVIFYAAHFAQFVTATTYPRLKFMCRKMGAGDGGMSRNCGRRSGRGAAMTRTDADARLFGVRICRCASRRRHR